MEDRWKSKGTTSVRKAQWLGIIGLCALWGFGVSTAQVIQGGEVIPPVPLGPTVTLAWDASADPAVSGYRLYQGLVSRNYSIVYDAGNTNNVVVPGLLAGTIYFFAVTAYDTNGLESDFSTELVYTNGSSTNSSLQIVGMAKSADGNFTITGTGSAGQNCVLMAATNLAPPVAWTPIATNVIRAPGAVTFTDLQATNYPSRFYQLWQPGAALGSTAVAAARK